MHTVYFVCVCVLPFGSVFIYAIVKLYTQAFNLPTPTNSSFKLSLKMLKVVMNINATKQFNPRERAPLLVASKCDSQECYGSIEILKKCDLQGPNYH